MVTLIINLTCLCTLPLQYLNFKPLIYINPTSSVLPVNPWTPLEENTQLIEWSSILISSFHCHSLLPPNPSYVLVNLSHPVNFYTHTKLIFNGLYFFTYIHMYRHIHTNKLRPSSRNFFYLSAQPKFSAPTLLLFSFLLV